MIVFIYPNLAQLQYLNELNFDNVFVYTLRNNPNLDKIRYIKLEEIKNCKVVACNEEAIYLLNQIKNNNIELTFDKKCFDLINKHNAYMLFSSNNILSTKKSKYELDYPFIVKPNFGFGSIGVRRITNKEELNAYKNEFENLITNSDIFNFSSKYFPNEKNYIVYEEDESCSTFFSVPFIYDNTKNYITMFPIEGTSKFENCSLTDFYWNSFIFNPNGIDKDIKDKINATLVLLAKCFCKDSCICIAELFYNRKTKEIKVIEFSPRCPGGKMSMLINKATNIDLDKVFIDLNLGKHTFPANYDILPVKLKISMNELLNNEHSSSSFSTVFNRNLYYNFYYINRASVALIPGGFYPIHKGHQSIIDKAINESDTVVILVIDRKKSEVPVEKRAEWIESIYPNCIVIKAYNLPRIEDMKNIDKNIFDNLQNKRIKEILGDIKITHVYHSNIDNLNLAVELGASNVLVDCERKKIPISGTLIRGDIEKYKSFLDKRIYLKYKEFIKYRSK